MYRCEKVKRFKTLKTDLNSEVFKTEKELIHFISMNSKIELGPENVDADASQKSDDCHFDASLGTH